MARPERQLGEQLGDLGLRQDIDSLCRLGVRPGIAVRAAVMGEIPDRGPGTYSIRKALDTARRQKMQAELYPHRKK